jgi:hypothetical protein
VRKKDMSRYGIGLLFILTLLAISAAPLIQATATDSSTTDEVSLLQKVPLTDSEIESRWPHLPTAQEIYNNGCLVIDLRYCGKQVSSMNDCLPDPDSPTVIDIESIIVNCTMDIPDFLHGGILRDVPHIWLQYDNTTWVQVPMNILGYTSN